MNKKLEEQIKKSGNNLHLDVARKLGNEGWLVEVSSYYVDDISTAPREIDIVAQKKVEIRQNNRFDKDMGEFKVYLFIECKYFKKGIAFRLLDNNQSESEEAITVVKMNKNTLLQPGYFAFNNHHYYTQTKIAKLHDVEESKEQNNVFSAITQPIKSLIFQRDQSREQAIYYPLVVYRGIDGTYGIDNQSYDNLDDAIQNEHMVYGLNYAYRRPVDGHLLKQMFYIDFVHENKLSDYLNLITGEAEELRKSLYFMASRNK